MHQVYLSLGSNIDPERYIYSGVAALRELFGDVLFSSVYRSPAVGFDGSPFLNLVAEVKTWLPLEELAASLRALEYRYGRESDSAKFSSRYLDIDILTFDNYHGVFDRVILPRPEVIENAYVLCPFAELAPDLILTGQSKTLRQLWRCYSNPLQRVTSVGSVDRLLEADDTLLGVKPSRSESRADQSPLNIRYPSLVKQKFIT